MLFRTLLFLAFLVPFTGTEGKITTFSGKWQFDEAHSSYNLTTKVIKDLPDHLKMKIPNYDVPRLAGIPRYFSTSPILVIKVVGGRLTISAPQWFTGWIPFDAEFLVDGKQREKNVGVGGHRSKSQWEEARIVREWSMNDASIYESSEGRDVLSLSEDGKTLTVECRRTHKLRMKVDDSPYELDDVEDIRSVFVKIR
jgi:hypothetical protein